jgi:cell pole-organizing protein PopZ
MSKPVLAQDQSVEEILASIRQAISADQGRHVASAPPAARPAEPADRPIELTSAEESKGGTATSADRSRVHDVIEDAIERALDGVDPEELRAETGRPVTRPNWPKDTPQGRNNRESGAPRSEARTAAPAPATPPPRGLVSARTNAAVAASFEDLSRVMTSRAVDLDQAVNDLLRPMLKTWLDENLPSLVERLVREEIERVSRGRR